MHGGVGRAHAGWGASVCAAANPLPRPRESVTSPRRSLAVAGLAWTPVRLLLNPEEAAAPWAELGLWKRFRGRQPCGSLVGASCGAQPPGAGGWGPAPVSVGLSGFTESLSGQVWVPNTRKPPTSRYLPTDSAPHSSGGRHPAPPALGLQALGRLQSALPAQHGEEAHRAVPTPPAWKRERGVCGCSFPDRPCIFPFCIYTFT